MLTGAGAEVSLRRSIARWRAQGAGVCGDGVRRVPRARVARAPARSSRQPRSAPIAIAWTCGRRRRPPPTTRTARARLEVLELPDAPTATSPMPLDGLWLRGPFLHNGSVPVAGRSARAVEARPDAVLARLRRVRSRARRLRHDRRRGRARGHALRHVQRPGNSNAGHIYGTTARRGQARAARVHEDALATRSPRRAV